MSKKLTVGCSPLTGTIYAGKLLKDGHTWAAGKQDVTDQAVAAVAQNLVHTGQCLVFTYRGKRYRLLAQEELVTHPDTTVKEHKHCSECKGCYGYHYPSCSKRDPNVEYADIEEKTQ